MTQFCSHIALLLNFYMCQIVDSVDLRYMRLACGSVTGLALGCRAHISLNLHISSNKRHSFGIFSSLHLSFVGARIETFPVTLQAFLCLTVHCAALRLAEYERSIPDEPGQPRLLPAAICDTLSLPQQQDWWQATYCLYSNSNRFVHLTFEKGRSVMMIELFVTRSMSEISGLCK